MKQLGMAGSADSELRKQLLSLLEGKWAHLDFASAVNDFPMAEAGSKPEGAPHSGWELLEHLRITQRDILDFCTSSNYQHLEWPRAYWPSAEALPDVNAWTASVAAFEKDLEAIKKLASDEGLDLYKPLANGKGQTLLREILLVADHNSHHLGQLLFLKKMLGAQAKS